MVDGVDVVSQCGQTRPGFAIGSYRGVHDFGQETCQFVRADLLHSIGPGIGRVGVDLNHQAIVVHQHGCGGKWCQKVGSSTNMARVTEDGNVGHLAAEFHRHLPQGSVPVAVVVVHAESTVYGADVPDADLLQPFHGAEP